MKVYEILSLNGNLLEKLHGFGITPDDCRFLSMYYEYRKMKDEGCKVVYIVAVLAQRYNVCERKVYKVIRHMEEDCHARAVG